MTPETADLLMLESERVYVVYDSKTGEIAHIHRVWTFRGGRSISTEEQETRALELAGRFGHRAERLRVLRADKFDRQLPQRVDVKARKLIPVEPLKARATKAAKHPVKRTQPKQSARRLRK